MILYIFKHNELYAKLEKELENYQCYEFKNGTFIPSESVLHEVLDILPEGIDLALMLKRYNRKNPLDLLPYLKNTIGDFSFSYHLPPSKHLKADNLQFSISQKYMRELNTISNITIQNHFPNILNAKIDIPQNALKPSGNTDSLGTSLLTQSLPTQSFPMQKLSLSGYQHKLQVSIIDNVIREAYSDFILKPANEFYNLAINEHLNVSFMGELGFEVPQNGIVYDERFAQYHYLIKRFDRGKSGESIPLISLNALMQSNDKYSGSIEKICDFLHEHLDDSHDRLEQEQRLKFLSYIYANALVFNNDLHKKNISFVFKNNALRLSPTYDVINIYAVKKLENMQCALPINGKLNRICIDDFAKASKKLGLDFATTKEVLNKILDVYMEKYPQYIARLSDIPQLAGVKELKHRFTQSYEQNMRPQKVKRSK